MKLIQPKQKITKEMRFNGSAKELLKKLNINSETVILSVNGTVVGDDHQITDTDQVTIFSVISGG